MIQEIDGRFIKTDFFNFLTFRYRPSAEECPND